MGKKGKKTRWRRLPIGGAAEEGGLSLEPAPPATDSRRITFNEDEYTKITTPRQDVLFKKGYFGRKRTTNPSPSETQEIHSGDSVESESYMGEEAQYTYPTGYMDPNGVYYVNGSTYEAYDPYTGTVTVVVGPPSQYPGGPPVLAALPCQPVPLQPLEWFNPPAPWCYSYNRRKRYSTDSQNCSAQSSESTGPPGSPQEPADEGACAVYPPQYVYPGYMFGPPIYNMNGVTMQGMVPQPVPLPPDTSAGKRRKKRRRRRRGGVTDDGSESSCCEEPSCDVTGCQSETSSDVMCQSGASSDVGVGPGSASSKANSDSGINTDPTPNSGSNSPPLHIVPTVAQVTDSVNNIQLECHKQLDMNQLSASSSVEEEQSGDNCVLQISQELPLCSNEGRSEFTGKDEERSEFTCKDEERSVDEAVTPEEVSEVLSLAEDDVTPNLCAAAPEFSSQESTLSCLSTPSATKDLIPNEQEISNIDISQEENFESCVSLTDTIPCPEVDQICEALQFDELSIESVSSSIHLDTTLGNYSSESFVERNDRIDNRITSAEKKSTDDINEVISEVKVDEIQMETESVQVPQTSEVCLFTEEDNQLKESINQVNEICEQIIESYCSKIASFESPPIMETDQKHLNNSSFSDTLAPVPPPRRKRSMCRAADRLATRIVEEAIRDGIEEAACVRLKGPISITEAVTRWLNSQGSSPLTCPESDNECDDDEGIEVGEDLTGQKNVQGNPFLVSSHSGTGQRVAKDLESMESSAGEWDMWDHSHTREICDPARSVDRYYRLTDDGLGDRMSPTVYKTAMHIRHSGPFPCGVCCIIQ